MSTPNPDRPAGQVTAPAQSTSTSSTSPMQPISSRELFKDRTVIDIDHEGRIYRLRVTQLGKLILTA